MIVPLLGIGIINIAMALVSVISAPINAIMQLVEFPEPNPLKIILGYMDYFYYPGFLRAILLALTSYLVIQLGLWLIKKVNDLPLMP